MRPDTAAAFCTGPATPARRRAHRERQEAVEKFARARGFRLSSLRQTRRRLSERAARLRAIRERLANSVGNRGDRPGAHPRDRAHAVGIRALWSPTSGIPIFGRVALALPTGSILGGGPAGAVLAIRGQGGSESCARRPATSPAATSSPAPACGPIRSRPDRSGLGNEGIVPFRGDCYAQARRALVRGLIYPFLDPGFPFSAHFTRTISDRSAGGITPCSRSRAGLPPDRLPHADLGGLSRSRDFAVSRASTGEPGSRRYGVTGPGAPSRRRFAATSPRSTI